MMEDWKKEVDHSDTATSGIL